MEDYIDILLEHLSEFQLQELGYEYFAQKSQEEATLAALEATFSDTQRTLFLLSILKALIRMYADAKFLGNILL